MERATRRAFLLLIVFLLFTLLAAPGVTAESRTIDDTNGDSVTGAKPSYHGAWGSQDYCDFCSGEPSNVQHSFDLSRVHDGTFHASHTANDRITFTFTGTSINIFFVVPLAGQDTACTFWLDGVSVGAFHIVPDNAIPPILFNDEIFGLSGLGNTQHTFDILVQDLVMFDYATYEFDDTLSSQPSPTTSQPSQSSSPSSPSPLPSSPSPLPSSPSPLLSIASSDTSTPLSSQSVVPSSGLGTSNRASVPIAAIVGGSIGGLLGLVLLVWFLCRRRRRRQNGIMFIPGMGERVVASSMRSVDTSSSSIEGAPLHALRLAVAIKASKRVLGGRVHTRWPGPVLDSKTLAAARRAVLDAAARHDHIHSRASGSTSSPDDVLSVVSSGAPVPGTPWTPQPPLSESEQHVEADLLPVRGADQDPYFQALRAERERVNAEVARMDAELAHLRNEYAEGAPPTYISDNGSDGASAALTAGGVSVTPATHIRTSVSGNDKPSDL